MKNKLTHLQTPKSHKIQDKIIQDENKNYNDATNKGIRKKYHKFEKNAFNASIFDSIFS